MLVCAGASPAATLTPLTDIREIRALAPERAAEKLPVKVRGVITRLTPHELFLQDGRDAIFVGRNDHDPALRTGDYIEVRGFTDSGHFGIQTTAALCREFPGARDCHLHLPGR